MNPTYEGKVNVALVQMTCTHEKGPNVAKAVERIGQAAAAGANIICLQELFAGRTKKSEMIGLFLATLELIRQKKVSVEQPNGHGNAAEVVIKLREDSGETIFQEETAPAAGRPHEV